MTKLLQFLKDMPEPLAWFWIAVLLFLGVAVWTVALMI